MRKNDLRPWLRERTYLLPVVGVVLVLASPVLLPVLVIWRVRKDLSEAVVDYYRECAGAFERVT